MCLCGSPFEWTDKAGAEALNLKSDDGVTRVTADRAALTVMTTSSIDLLF